MNEYESGPTGDAVPDTGHDPAARPALDELFNKVPAIPGASDALKPSIDAMKAKLDTLAKAAG